MSIALRFHIQRGEFALNIDTVIPGSGVTVVDQEVGKQHLLIY